MKRFITICTIALMLVFVVANLTFAADNGGLRYTVSVNQFENKAQWGCWNELGNGWGEIMTEVLTKSGRFVVLGEADMRSAALEEQKLTGGTHKIMPAQLLVKGAITNVQNTGGGGVNLGGVFLGGSSGETQINATFYLMETATGRVIGSKSVVGQSKRGGIAIGLSGAFFANNKSDNHVTAMTDAIDQGVRWLTEQLPKVSWRGNIIMTEGGNIYVNRGERDGVKVGQTFVAGSTKELRDPGTNEVLDEVMNESGRLQVVSVKEKVAICTVISGSVNKGMRVQLP